MADRNLRIRMIFDAAQRVTGPLREIMSGSNRTGASLKATRDRLRELNQAQQDVSGFRKLKAEIGSTEAKLQEAQARVAQLAREMRSAEQPTKKLQNEFGRAKREAAGLKLELNGQGAELQQLRSRLSAAGINTSRLSEDERELRQRISATNRELSEQARRLDAANDRKARFAQGRENFTRIQDRATGLAAGGGSAIATGYVIGQPILQAEGEAREYQSVMTDIAQKADLSRQAARKMGVDMMRTARAVNQFPEDLQQGVDALAGFGMDPRRAIALAQPLGKAATAYKAAMGDLASATFAANDNLKVADSDTRKVIDVMAQAGKAGAFEMRDMASYFPSLTASAQALGQKGVPAVADLAAALQITRKGAGDSSTAANNLLNLMNKINTEDTIKNFKEFGIDLPKAMKKAAKDGKSPIEAIAELTNKATKGDVSKLAFLFGDAQVQAAMRPLIQNMDEYRRIRAQAMNADGTVDRDFAERMKDSTEIAKRYEIQMRAVRQTVGDRLQPTFDTARSKLTQLGERFVAWADRHPVATQRILTLVAGMATLLVIAGGLAIAAAGVLAPFAALSFVAGALGTSVGGLALRLLYPLKIFPLLLRGVWMLAGGIFKAGAFLLANPLILAIVAIVAAVAFAGYMIWKHWDKIKAAFTIAVGIIGLALKGIWNRVTTAFTSVMSFLGGLHARFVAFGANIIQGLINGITGMLGKLKNTIVGAASSAANWFKSKLGIRSPSRVFMGLGGFVMQGLERGIEDGEGAPVKRLDNLSKKMAAAIAIGTATPALAVGGGANAGGGAGAGGTNLAGGSAVTIQIYAAPGQSEEEIARIVMQKLEEERRKKSARGRSAFRDEDYGD